ncbi:MAG TPA: thiamine phosphate synthase, partial [Dokdonella sp.]|nr:thiamine phosphate synthase [Dokdonella sp.]
SPTKPLARLANPELLVAARSLGIPLVAIGGITPDNAPLLIAAGADCTAVISSLFDADDIESVARRFSLLFS